MAGTYDITVDNTGFTATVTQNAAGSWSWSLTSNNGDTVSGNFGDTFEFTSAFKMGDSDEYEFGAGSVVTSGSKWSGSVTYPSVTTNWTAQKKSGLRAA
jgi:hypothetical protein